MNSFGDAVSDDTLSPLKLPGVINATVDDEMISDSDPLNAPNVSDDDTVFGAELKEQIDTVHDIVSSALDRQTAIL